MTVILLQHKGIVAQILQASSRNEVVQEKQESAILRL